MTGRSRGFAFVRMEDAGGFSSAIRELDGKEVFEDGTLAKDVVVREEKRGGILISTSGFSTTATEGLTEIGRNQLRFGDGMTIVSFCRTYLNVSSGLVYPVNYADTIMSLTKDSLDILEDGESSHMIECDDEPVA